MNLQTLSPCRSTDGQLLVAADDFGHVRLYNYPCCNVSSAYAAEPGHSSHVMMARFTCDASRVISVGGYDRAVFQWEVIRNAPREGIEEEIHEMLSGMNWGQEASNSQTNLADPTAGPSEAARLAEGAPEHIQRDPEAMKTFLLAKRDSGKKYKNSRLAELQREMDLQIEALARKDEERKMRLQALASEKDAIDAALAAPPSRLYGKKAQGRKDVEGKGGKVWGMLDETGTKFGWVDDLDLLGGGVSDDEGAQ